MSKLRPKIDRRISAFLAVVILVVVLAAGSIAWMRYSERGDGIADPAVQALAGCLTGKGAKMYGAYWCTHCNKQKQMFSSAFADIDYVECANQDDPQKQAPACDQAGVTSYPTWIFADGSRLTGEVKLEELATRAGCTYAPGIILDSDSVKVETIPVTGSAAEPE